FNRKIYFTNLAPGQYTFSVKASTDGRWSSRATELHIHILPPFWATAWAYLFYTLTALALFYYLVRSYHTHIEDKKEKEIYEAKLDFFTNITHEIRTPLTLIKGPVENLQELSEIVPELKEDVATLDRATNRLLSLINQILDFRKTERGLVALYVAKVNLTKLLQEEYKTFLPLAKKGGLAFTLHLPPAPVFIVADAEALQKIISNLFSNAVKYAGNEIKVSLTFLKDKEPSVALEITNDGPLIARDMRDRIFDPFYRLKGTTQPGTGIGLALARSLALLHGGRLYLKEGQKAENSFLLVLPVRPGKNGQALPPTYKPILTTKPF
ncbi:MAG TPA: ATP-binding protein, partial [Chitinophagaceae bacterium]|nr:ATP-binding protein [Chitinophagaceae bacterium]